MAKGGAPRWAEPVVRCANRVSTRRAWPAEGAIEPLSGAGVTGEAQPGSEAASPSRARSSAQGSVAARDEALAALADAAGQGE